MVTASRPSASASAMAPLTIVSRLSRSRATDPLLLFAIPPTVLCTGSQVCRPSVGVAECVALGENASWSDLVARCRGGARLFAALRPVGGYLLEERAQRVLLVGVQRGEHPLLGVGECVLYLSESATSGGREGDRVATAVLWGASALDELCGFQVVEQADEIGGVDPQ